jgi:hypothetical protein
MIFPTYQRLIIDHVLLFNVWRVIEKTRYFFFWQSFTSLSLVNTLVFSYNRATPNH